MVDIGSIYVLSPGELEPQGYVSVCNSNLFRHFPTELMYVIFILRTTHLIHHCNALGLISY